MGRVIKPADQRRMELMNAARELFIEQGYEQTTMSNIAKRANVAQGTSYIYFSSKQEILMAIMREMLETLAEAIQSLADRTDLPAPAVLRQSMNHCLTLVSQQTPVVEAVFLRANYSLPSQLLEQIAPTLLPIITSIIENGVREGSMKVTHPRLAADFLWTAGYRMFEMQAQQQFGRVQGDAANPHTPTISDLQDAFWEFVAQGLGVSESQT
ncbi:MAG TPA: TetR/AcrR family transcriptional regulator [Symbiobacteriaceae bacterium]|jgi:AcrR family transcriptional regulator|nr:TetR/AcrR family transcriptional regulator [Symbiobacteriaceae bacterium]